jgi:hypothetical protein
MNILSILLQAGASPQQGGGMGILFLLLLVVLAAVIVFAIVNKNQEISNLKIRLDEKNLAIKQLKEQLDEQKNNTAFKIGTDGTIIRVDESILDTDIVFCPYCGKKLGR